jgi:hypothetical protein
LELISLAAFALLAACSSTYFDRTASPRQAFYAGNLEAARSALAGLKAEEGEGGSEYPLLLLEEAIVEIAAGNSEPAIAALRKVRDAFDAVEEREVKAFFGEVGTYFSDERWKDYGGEDYEKILLRAFLAFADLLRDGNDVVAYANQVLEKQRAILDQQPPTQDGRPYKQSCRQVGLGAYLYGLVTEERDPTAASEVKLSYQKVKDWEPQFRLISADLERVQGGVHSQKGHGVVYVFAFVGKGPEKIEVEEVNLAVVAELTSQISRFIPILRDNFGATIDLSPIKLHQVQRRADNPIESVAVEAGGRPVGVAETITDVSATALQHYRATRDWVLAKAVIRRMVKKAITTGVKGAAVTAVRGGADRRHARNKGAGTELAVAGIEVAGILANTLWGAVERADTRYWSLLPDRIQALRFELPEGEHDIAILPQLSSTAKGGERRVRVEVRDGRNTYVFAFIPSPGAGPAPLTSRPARGAVALR